jgi:hypothetical protein
MRRSGARLLVLALTGTVSACAARGAGSSSPKAVDPLLSQLETHYAQRLAQHRPDLAERYGTPPYNTPFVPINESNADAHLNELRRMLADAETLPAGARADTMRARLAREIADTGPGGALREDPLLWLDVIAAAARAPFALGSANGCDRTHHATLQLRTLPEALRGAIVLMRTAQPPDPAELESRLSRVETLLRTDLPARTEPCKESRYRAEFVEADSLAAASLAQYRHWLTAGD